MKKNRMIKKGWKRILSFGILVTALAVSQNPAEAKMIRGQVVAVKDDGSSFSFKRSNPSNPSLVEQFDIVMLPHTKFEKISSLKELAAGDEVVADAAKNRESGIWEANSVRIFKVRLHQETPAPKTQLK